MGSEPVTIRCSGEKCFGYLRIPPELKKDFEDATCHGCGQPIQVMHRE